MQGAPAILHPLELCSLGLSKNPNPFFIRRGFNHSPSPSPIFGKGM